MKPSRQALLSLAVSAAVAGVPACHRTQDAALAALESAGEGAAGGPEPMATPADGGITLQADLPGDVYLPRARRVASVVDVGGMQMVNLSSPAAIRTLAAELEDSMAAAGWTREMALQRDGSTTLVYRKQHRQAIYQLAVDARGTQLALRTGGGG